MHNVSPGQVLVVVLAAACFAAAAGLSLARLWWDRPPLRVAGKAVAYAGLLAGLGVLVWHSADRGTWLPLGDNFDTLVCLGVLLAGFVLYTQVHRPLRGLDWFLFPVAAGLLAAAAVFGRAKPHEYVDTAWSWAHRVTAYGGAVAFAVAGAGGLMYLVASRRLKTSKLAGPGTAFGSLERLEHLTLVAVVLGFALLTVGAVTGLAKIAAAPHGDTQLGDRWYLSPKVLGALGVWVVYAIVLHAPLNPSFRGRRAAVLSVVGFVLMVGTLVATQFVPSRR
ncbi:MAG: ccsA 3 [Phycisphaerales bacterium]|nr:ccsA 3 [Phycisphaerales bacterium]